MMSAQRGGGESGDHVTRRLLRVFCCMQVILSLCVCETPQRVYTDRQTDVCQRVHAVCTSLRVRLRQPDVRTPGA